MKKLITAIIALSMLLTCLSGLAESVPTAFNKTGIRIDIEEQVDLVAVRKCGDLGGEHVETFGCVEGMSCPCLLAVYAGDEVQEDALGIGRAGLNADVGVQGVAAEDRPVVD